MKPHPADNSTPHSAPRTPHSNAPHSNGRRRTGKIARLSRDLRDLVNLMLRDGKSYSFIAQQLHQRGFDLTIDNLF